MPLERDENHIFVIWNSKKRRISMATYDEELARKLTSHYVEGVECTPVPIYEDYDEYLENHSEIIAEEARKKLTPVEYEAIKRTIEDEYPLNPEFDHEARILYD